MSCENDASILLYMCGDISVVRSPLTQYAGLLIAVAPRYRYCSGATFTVAVAVAPILLAESSGDSSAATFFSSFLALFATATFKKEN